MRCSATVALRICSTNRNPVKPFGKVPSNFVRSSKLTIRMPRICITYSSDLHRSYLISNLRRFQTTHSDARAYCKAGVLKIRASILHSLSHYGDGRARWTVAHELAHLVLEHPKTRLDRRRPNKPVPASDRIFEQEADTFAAEFLTPLHLVRKCTTAEEIRLLFQISPRAALRRKRELTES